MPEFPEHDGVRADTDPDRPVPSTTWVCLDSVGGGELGPGPFGVDDELEWTQLLVASSQVVEGAAPPRRQFLAGGIAHEAKLRELQPQGVVPALDESARAPDECVLSVAPEEVERRGPLRGREHFHSIAVRLPVPGGLVIDALEEVVAHDDIGQDGRGVLPQRNGQAVVANDLHEGAPFADARADALVELAQGRLDGG